MKLEFPIEEIVKNRYSARTYNGQPISSEIKEKINAYISTLSNPFSTKVSFSLIESEIAMNNSKLGTYGVIKGANNYIGATAANGDMALPAVGYEFEKLILYATSLGLGTCWLGGTFKRGEFAKVMSVKENEIFPAISPIGYPADKKSLKESFMRFAAKSNQRSPWNILFFNKDFQTPLTQAEAGTYHVPLEMVRLAPSASNKQPWRIVKEGNLYHFYEVKAPGYSERLGFDIQKLDLGIAACHFHLSAIEKGLKGEFKQLPVPALNAPEHTHYVFSWVSE